MQEYGSSVGCPYLDKQLSVADLLSIKGMSESIYSKGEWKYQTDGIIRIVLKNKNEYIVLTGKVVNQAFRIGDAWIWDKISNLWGSAR